MSSALFTASTIREAASHSHTAPSIYRNNRVAWIHDCILWRPGQGPTSYQDEIAAALDQYGKVAVVGPHGIGKTAIDALMVLHFGTTRDIESSDWKNPTVASAWRQLTHYLWPEIRKWARLIDWRKVGRDAFTRGELLKQNLKCRTGEAFAVASDDVASIEGVHADSVFYLLDESKTIPDDVWDGIEGAFAGAGPDTDAEAFALANSTPGPPLGRFYEIHARRPGFEDWHTIHVTLTQAITAGRISKDWAAQRAKQWGVNSAVYKTRVLGQFAEDDKDTVIPLSWVEAAMDRWRELHLDIEANEATLPHLLCVGADIAGSGEDKTVIARRHHRVILPLLVYDQQTTMETANLIDPLTVLAGTYSVVDVIGVGSGVVDRLRELGREVTPFNASERTARMDMGGILGFVNKRAAAWWNMREMLDPDSGEELCIPPDDELLGELVSPRWRAASGGKILVESKEDIQKRIHRSTDRADAVVMAFWPERPPIVLSTGVRPTRGITDDLLKMRF